LSPWKDLKLPDGRDRVVRHGHGPQRAIQTGVGPVEVRRAKVRDRGEVGAEEKIRFWYIHCCTRSRPLLALSGGATMSALAPLSGDKQKYPRDAVAIAWILGIPGLI
jgi:hypothetical protein